jgi:hypothetical protein
MTAIWSVAYRGFPYKHLGENPVFTGPEAAILFYTLKEALINSTKRVIAPRGHKRAKRGNLMFHNQSLEDCFVTAFLAMTN